MGGLRLAREKAGLSQRALAARAGVAFRTVQLMEAGRHDARLSTVEKLSAALGLAAPATREPFPPAGETLAEAAEGVLRDGFGSWKVHLFDFVDAFRRAPEPAAVERAPSARTDPRLLALWSGVVETLTAERGLPAPWWCAGIRPLAEPWFVSGVENLKAAALLESPAAFRRRGVFVLAGFLDRA